MARLVGLATVLGVAALGLPGLTGVAAAAESANIDQCANGPLDDPNECTLESDWVNGNLNATKAHYLEGDSVPYRAVLGDLDTSLTYSLTIEFDSIEQGKHAIDYLTTYNRTVGGADPCAGVAGCDTATVSTAPIPPPPLPFAPEAGVFTLFGGTITAVSDAVVLDLDDDTQKIRYTITFDPEVSTPVLAWGGHIATRADWAPEEAAVDISGSPYHMRLIDLFDGTDTIQLGNQDRSLSADAVIFPATITIIKQVDGGSSTDFLFTTTPAAFLTPDSFSLDDDADGTLSDTQVFSDIVDFDTDVTVTETDPGPAFSLTSLVCVETGLLSDDNSTTDVPTRTATIDLEEGEDVTCTFTNAQQAGSLTLNKVVTNDDGGTATAAQFTLTATGPDLLSGPGPTVGPMSVAPGVYTLSEMGPAGYAASAWSCPGATLNGADVTVPPGVAVVCTITNDDVAPTLGLDKTVVNDSGGTATEDEFVLLADGPTDVTDAGGDVPAQAVTAGTYTLSETGPAGYTASAWTCTNGVVVTNSQITLGIGQSTVCSITNDDQAASLALNKTVVNDDGGTATEEQFVLLADGTTDLTDAGGDVPLTPVPAGAYVLSETGPAGYAPSGWSCIGTGSQVGTTVTLDSGETMTCSITNDDIPASLGLNKTVVNNSGGTAVENDFVLLADGPTDVTDAGGDVPAQAVPAGVYTLSETGVTGYSASAWTCSNGVTVNGANQITLALGQSTICSITNDDDTARLGLDKTVVNDNGGTAVEDDFVLLADGPTDVTDAGGDVPAQSVSAGTYTLSESGPGGYVRSSWTCTNGVTVNGNSQITLAPGATTTCSITNNDIPPSLRLVKVVTNNNGGQAVATDFTLTATGPTPNLSGAGGFGPTLVLAGAYTLSETNLPGYAPSGWSCVGGTQNGATITLGVGQAAVCTITNDDTAASLGLNKTVVNNSGGTATENSFVLLADGPTDVTDAGGDVPAQAVSAGIYTLSETGPTGYAASAWTCTNGVAVSASNQITLALGQSTVCSITNDDQAASLGLNKTVVNDSGGTATENSFVLLADGPTDVTDAGGDVPAQAVSAGIYALSETGPSGYAASAWTCTNGVAVSASNQITLALGQSTVCSITNDDQAASLGLNKTVVNDSGGTAVENSFVLLADGPTDVTDAGGDVPAQAVSAGIYTLSETGPAGYAASAWTCTNGVAVSASNQITLALGQSTVCSITNDDIPPTVLPTVITKPPPTIPRTGPHLFRDTGFAIVLVLLGIGLRRIGRRSFVGS